MTTDTQAWYTTWFDSPYYHILYKDRNKAEAEEFLDKLLVYLHPKPHHTILDLACGKGRHAVYLSSKGYTVTGVDLSEQNIAEAKKHEEENLTFEVHDMREPFHPGHFDFVLNLFTSFGYFEDETDNVVALRAAVDSLKPGGKLVIDFMNTEYAIRHLVAHETKTVDGITFDITRKLHNGFIEKFIRFEDKGEQHEYVERVRALGREEFEEYFTLVDVRLADVFGSYNLHPYHPTESERMIFVLKKY